MIRRPSRPAVPFRAILPSWFPRKACLGPGGTRLLPCPCSLRWGLSSSAEETEVPSRIELVRMSSAFSRLGHSNFAGSFSDIGLIGQMGLMRPSRSRGPRVDADSRCDAKLDWGWYVLCQPRLSLGHAEPLR